MRLDQLQRYVQTHGLIHAVAFHMDLDHLDWISKDTDMQADHWNKHSLSWPVLDGVFDLDNWAKDIAQKLEAEPAYVEYQPTIGSNKGIILVYGFRIHPNPQTPSGWNVVFQYTYVDPEKPLM
ncbi:hypothetical protein D5P86_01335 [Salmonella enterica subsp. enterica serovar Infantis]|nr:hypothetical protein [Salmonella enterica subsp. enterica serovar Infantis]